MTIYTTLSFILIFMIKNGCCLDSPSFRIISPQNVCNSLLANNSTSKVFEGAVITFQPKNNIKFMYKFRIFFKLHGSENFSQRETLIIWKAVRALEYRINILERTNISSNNLIFLKKSELISGVKYIFHVVGITEKGESSREEIFILNYSNGILHNGNISDGLNLLLIGSNVAVASSSYILYAKVSFCVQNYNYHVRWKIIVMDETFENVPGGRGSVLHIPKNSLIAGSSMKIFAQVLDSHSNKMLAQDYLHVEVVKKGFHAYILPSTAKIGVFTSLSLQIIILDYDNNPNLEIIWQFYEANTKVDGIVKLSLDHNKCIVSFKKIGRYKAIAYVTIDGVKMNVSAEIEVILNAITSFDFKDVPNITPPSNEIFTFSAHVSDLIPKCKAGWISVQEEGFEYIAIDELHPQYSGYVQIFNLEEKYLSEIIDMKNLTESRDIKLYIPHIRNNKWKGLQGDKKYKFRLGVECPMIHSEILNENSPKPVVSSNIEFYIVVNPPPRGTIYKIEPETGYALETIFRISIAEATDFLFDQPLFYELCGIFDGFEVCFGKYMEYRLWEIVLPFTKTACRLYVIICDIRNACETVYGKLVEIKPSNISKEVFELQKNKIKSTFLRKDFMEALTDVSLISITLKNYNSELLFQFKNFVHSIIQMELDKLTESGFITNTNNIDTILDLILNVKENLQILSIKDEYIQQKLICIMESIEFKTSTFTTVKTIDRNVTMDLLPFTFIKTYAEIFLYIIEDTLNITYVWNYEGEKFVIDHVLELSAKICLQYYFSSEKIETSNISFIVTKYKGTDLSKMDFFVSNSSTNINLKIKITFRNVHLWVSENKNYCIVIILWSKDYLTNGIYPITYVRVFDLFEKIPIMEWTSKEDGDINTKQNIIELEVSKIRQDINMCSIWTNKNWSTGGCETQNTNLNSISCCFSYLGFYRFYLSNDRDNRTNRLLVSKNIIANKNNNQILSISSTMGSTRDFTIPFTMSPIVSTENIQHLSTNIMILNDTTIHKDTNKNSYYNRASTTSFAAIFLTFIILVVLLILFTFYRRFLNRQKCLLINELIRHRQNTVTYARVHDGHLMGGSF